MRWHQLIRLTGPRAGRNERPGHSAGPRPVHAEHDDHLAAAGVPIGLGRAQVGTKTVCGACGRNLMKAMHVGGRSTQWGLPQRTE